MRMRKTTGLHRKRTLLFFCILCVLFSFEPSFAAGLTRNKKILLLHSYHKEYPWTIAITTGVWEALSGRDTITLETMYMDAKRHTSDEFKYKAAQSVIEKIDTWQPDVVIACDDIAQIFVVQHYVDKKPYFVFCGVNADPATYGFPASNVTGIVERPHFKESIEYLRQIVPSVRKVAIISDSGATSLGALNFMESEKIEKKVSIKITNYKLIEDFSLWKKRVLEYNVDVDALLLYTYHTLKEEGSILSLDAESVLRWTIEHCNVPTVGFFDFSIEGGLLCGVVESGQEHGFEAATMALALLDGADITTLPIRRGRKEIRMLNMRTARKLGITISDEVLKITDKVIE